MLYTRPAYQCQLVELALDFDLAWFSYVGKIPDDRGFYFLPTNPDFAHISDIRQRSVPDFPDYELFICDRGTGAQKFRGDGNERNPSPTYADVPDGTNLRFHLSGMIADHSRNLGRVGKIETLPILQICPHSSQTIGDIYDFEFSLVGKIWDGRETVKIFPTYENQA